MRAECKPVFKKPLLAGFTQRKNLCQNIRAWGFMFFIQPVVTLALGAEEVFMCYNNVPSTYTTNFLRSFYVKKNCISSIQFFFYNVGKVVINNMKI